MNLNDLTGFLLVYQGGNHNVYCNGEEHAITTGGYTQSEIDITKAIIYTKKKCDCEEWAKYRNGDRPTPPIFDNCKVTINENVK